MLLNSEHPTIRDLARVIGKIISSLPGIMHGALYYRCLEKDKTLYLTKSKGNFEHTMQLSENAISELQWWTQRSINAAYNVIAHDKPSHIITTDASKKGWGAEYNGVPSGGLWKNQEWSIH